MQSKLFPIKTDSFWSDERNVVSGDFGPTVTGANRLFEGWCQTSSVPESQMWPVWQSWKCDKRLPIPSQYASAHTHKPPGFETPNPESFWSTFGIQLGGQKDVSISPADTPTSVFRSFVLTLWHTLFHRINTHLLSQGLFFLILGTVALLKKNSYLEEHSSLVQLKPVA